MRLYQPDPRRGAAIPELAVVLPLLVFLFVITVDFGRVFYYSLTVTSCAQEAALYASDRAVQLDSPYTIRDADGKPDPAQFNQSVLRAAQSEAPADLRNLIVVPAPTYSTNGDTVSVSVRYTFKTISYFPGIPDTWDLTRTVTMRVAPQLPS